MQDWQEELPFPVELITHLVQYLEKWKSFVGDEEIVGLAVPHANKINPQNSEKKRKL